MRLLAFALLFPACNPSESEPEGGDDTVDTAPPEDLRPEPVYTGAEACPEIVEDENEGFLSSGEERKFRVVLPAEPQGAPVLFAWHWLGGNSRQIINYMGMDEVAEAGAIVVAPDSNGNVYEWDFIGEPDGNVDLVLFDDLLGCLYEQYDVDLDRVYATGMSAGGLWTTYLTMHRSEWLASTAIFSGGNGVFTSYATPTHDIPVLAIWGGVDDLYSGLSFDDATRELIDNLRADGHFVAACDHGGGHTLPSDPMGFGWEWLEAHPKGVDPEPYAQGLPSDFPDYCYLPEGELYTGEGGE